MVPDPERAMRHLSAALAIRPRSAPNHDDFGIALASEGRREEAVTVFRKAVNLRPACLKAHNDLAFALMKAGRLEEPEGSIVAALELVPGQGIALATQGENLLAMGRFVGAADVLERAVARGKPSQRHPSYIASWPPFPDAGPQVDCRDRRLAVNSCSPRTPRRTVAGRMGR
jgi:Flp pilus assembly protein TadD